MPTLYRYLGYIILFYSNEHLPIHLHIQYNGLESVIELHFNNGVLTLAERKAVGKKPLSEKDLKKVKSFILLKQDEIVTLWKDYHIFNKEITPKTITRVLKAKKKKL